MSTATCSGRSVTCLRIHSCFSLTNDSPSRSDTREGNVSVTFPSSRETRKLIRRGDQAAVGTLISYLWHAEVAENPSFAHPYYWSPFVLLNNWL